MELVAWQRSLVAAPSPPPVGRAQWAHSHLDMHLLLKVPVVLEDIWSPCCTQGRDCEDKLSLRGAPGTRRSPSCYSERVKLFGRTQTLNQAGRSLEDSYEVLIVTKMTQPPHSLRDLSAYAVFHSSSLTLPLLVSAKVSISERGTERRGSGSTDVGF